MWSVGLITINNEEKAIALSNGLDRVTVLNRVGSLHWDIERAITEPIKKKINKFGYTKQDIQEAAANGIGEKTFQNRLYVLHMSVEDAKTKPLMWTKREAK